MGSDDGEDADLGLLNAKIVDIFAKVALGTIGVRQSYSSILDALPYSNDLIESSHDLVICCRHP